MRLGLDDDESATDMDVELHAVSRSKEPLLGMLLSIFLLTPREISASIKTEPNVGDRQGDFLIRLVPYSGSFCKLAWRPFRLSVISVQVFLFSGPKRRRPVWTSSRISRR